MSWFAPTAKQWVPYKTGRQIPGLVLFIFWVMFLILRKICVTNRLSKFPPWARCHAPWGVVFTARQRSCGKVMFSVMSVCLSFCSGGCWGPMWPLPMTQCTHHHTHTHTHKNGFGGKSLVTVMSWWHWLSLKCMQTKTPETRRSSFECQTKHVRHIGLVKDKYTTYGINVRSFISYIFTISGFSFLITFLTLSTCRHSFCTNGSR